MKVLMPILHYRPVIGGFEIFTQNIAERLAKTMDVFVVTGRVRHTANKERKGGLRVFRHSLFGLKDLSRSSWSYILTAMPFIFLRSFYMIKREKIGLVHCQGRLSGILGYLLKKTVGVPYIITIQSADFSVYHPKANIKPVKWIYNFLRKKIYQNAAVCHAVSYYLKEHFVTRWGIKDATVIPNGVNQKDFKPDKNKRATRKELGLDTENLIICISRLEPKNGTEDLVKAADVLKKNPSTGSGLNFKIAIIGSGSQKKKLEKLIQNLGLRNKVVLLGEIPHGAVPKYLACADIFIRPSLAEGFGIVFIEAMACEVPVIGTLVGGIPDFIKDPSAGSGQATGLFCKPGNPKSIAEKIETLIEDKKLRNTLVKNAKEMVLEVYNWDKVSERIKKVYQGIL